MRIPRLLLVCSELLLFSGALILFATNAAAQLPMPAGPMHLTEQPAPADPMQETGQTQQKSLRVLNESPIRLPSTSPLALLGAPQCDSNGALFLRVAPSGAKNRRLAPVYKISPAGASGTSFSLSNVPGFELAVTAQTHEFAVSDDGGVYFLSQKDTDNGHPALYVIHFAAWGQHLATVKLGQFFSPRGFVLLPDGSFFVLGMARDEWDTQTGAPAATNAGTRPVGAFYGPKGKLNYEINLPRAATPKSPENSSAALVAAGSNGDVYVMRYKPAFSFYVIGHGGARVHSFTIDPPFSQAAVKGIAPVALKKVAVEFTRAAGAKGPAETLISIVSTETGNRLIDYQVPPDAAGLLGCYTQNGFELLAKKPGGSMSIRFVRGK